MGKWKLPEQPAADLFPIRFVEQIDEDTIVGGFREFTRFRRGFVEGEMRNTTTRRVSPMRRCRVPRWAGLLSHELHRRHVGQR
jgi:hypothetical protein